MNKKDNIEELFKNRFSDFEADVDAQVWSNIESELANMGGGSSTGVEKSIFSSATTWVAAVSVSAILGVGYVMFSDDAITDETDSSTEIVEGKEVKTINKSTDEIEVTESPETTNNQNNQNNQTEFTEEQTQIEDKKVEEVSKGSKTNENSITENTISSDSKSNSNPIVSEETPVNKAEPKGEVSTAPQVVEVEAATPNKIVLASQSSVLASPMGGIAPLDVSFSTLAEKPVKIKWDFDDGNKSEDETPNHTYAQPGIYFVTMIAELENGEIVMDKAVVEVKSPLVKKEEVTTQSQIRVGNVFTPNNDGENDVFKVICTGMESFSMSIYSVNGQLVFQTENPQEYWDGTDLGGAQVPAGTYYYLINAIGEDQNIYAPKGYISVYR